METHCSERRLGWQVPEFSGGISDCSSAADSERNRYAAALPPVLRRLSTRYSYSGIRTGMTLLPCLR
jgi:hypothetical protein